ncbi:NADH-quinone oxidoreductase subunit NuoN [Sutcliffiella halmapala]|uniref:NADH-quinone oxidoreductase subunit NuoN n=1 Tax=Sutcliffiella halmapala TaxID=79882 RepID=UPI000995A676|nr:NADH-quinone oxidoreductase subunit NuoN [Sutcliffiella halmapala]
MDLETLLSFKWGAMAPEFIILGVATLLTLLDLFLPKKIDRRVLGWFGFAGILVAIGFLVGSFFEEGVTTILYETYRLDSFAKAFKLLLLVGAAFVMLMAVSYDPKESLKEYRGEFYYLLLAGLLGTMIMASSGDLITLFVGLELLSLSSYVLAGLRKKNQRSNEAAMKYVINGGIATAITLFGMSYVYGLTGTTNLIEMAQILNQTRASDMQYLLMVAFIMMFVGLSFKLATAPFHMWAPDVYQGAPTPVTAFLAVVSKTAGFIIVARLFITLFLMTPAQSGEVSLLFSLKEFIAILAVISMVIGNTVALRQRNVKRMLAYSGIAHAGYLLVAISSINLVFLFETMWFYLVAYLLMNIGALAILQVVTRKSDSEDVSQFAGLYQRSPLLAVLMSIFLLSLAGIPGTAGFIGKLSIFMGAITEPSNAYVLASVLIATTVISYFYYFGIMTQMFFRPAADQEKIKIPVGIWITIILCGVGTIAFGILPGLAIDFFNGHFDVLFDFFNQASQ